MIRHTVRSAFLGYASPPYPAVVCTSINHVIVHGASLRKSAVLKEGDIIGIDFGIYKHGFCADTARTVMIGQVDPAQKRLVDTAREFARCGDRLVPGRGATGWAISGTRSRAGAESRGYSSWSSPSSSATDHRQMHEDPQVKNFFGEAAR